ncbi:hypothetical protein CVU82_00345 [Candidatus Falkowbacteria bacterium HGW-Falkowbacteria-1]|jgi:glycosyltransferase involved in cell wall biosynthesis|uniref:Glycosyltransferase family 4 protein n=1 Tax=Candidatus Falkowbacteria bacterium HGW-Falkowbacteria-1 TaxID=2013768 RepID=A0A2N2EAD4_9BACT|nr:MAG: hypothetical protein CVU82_00345 [Candidatus Falkowbacteria bacterium HGW-Falkowbacteria-1]
MKRILILNYEFPPLGGGAGNATHYLLREFSGYHDLEIDLVTSSVDEFKIEKIYKNVTVHFLNIGKKNKRLHYQTLKDILVYSFKAYFYSKKLKKRKNFDFCHAFFGIPCGYIAMKLELPYIISLRGSDVPFYSKRFYFLDKILFKRLSFKLWKNAKKVIANSEDLMLLALEVNKNQKIVVIGNGVDTQEFKPLEKKLFTRPIKAISTGRLIERKGYEFLIEAISGLQEMELELIGDGRIKDKLKKIAKEKNVNIKFLGKKSHDQIASYLQRADIFVLPSLNEGMSNSILEAMSCGLPIIMTDTGGKELIKNNGFIVKKGSAEELKLALTRFVNEPRLILEMGKNSRELAEKISWKIASREYRKIYDLI